MVRGDRAVDDFCGSSSSFRAAMGQSAAPCCGMRRLCMRLILRWSWRGNRGCRVCHCLAAERVACCTGFPVLRLRCRSRKPRLPQMCLKATLP